MLHLYDSRSRCGTCRRPGWCCSFPEAGPPSSVPRCTAAGVTKQAFHPHAQFARVAGAKNVVVPVTSDKGLCGGINTTVCK